MQRNQIQRQYYLKHKEKIDNYVRSWQKENPERVRITKKRYVERHPDRVRESSKRWKKKNPDKVKAQLSRFRERHRNEIRIEEKNFYDKNRRRILRNFKKLYWKNPEKYRQKARDKIRKAKESLLKILGATCTRCGFNENIVALDFHHVDRSHKMKEGEWKRKQVDPSGLIVLCANCHRIIHANERYKVKTECDTHE